ncbi:hypothetical protein [Tumebacillus flagellatus]|uniref:Uncharacterized protein n=1 Tax=Tumebacillus flagellatus TaxID=1157490 RepID=A0A074M857_9BACL|nr:hypothetical protein [Tumebacillus flagellatus]KEO82137.1 hypothetical protein EL26_17080 [Tumebacillus flagellatus]
MSMILFNGLMIGVFVFAALMVLVKFAFYKRQEEGMRSAYFWGGILFLALAVTDITSSVVYRTELHEVQTLLFLSFAGLAMFRFTRMKTTSAS